ncbi:MAG: UDP-glucose 4-epimerase GalE [Burkholderiales bacterium]|nr:MAG: UDP-glucose 4-epimerase GalE [Burkholderiales bacterium]
MNILVTGGAGYIGSITTVQLLAAGLNAVILDNFANSKPAVLARIERVAGRAPVFVQGDVRDRVLLERVLGERQIDAVIHFAGLKAVGESVSMPLAYYDNNVHGTVQLLEAMHAANVRTMVFSSSATVYGEAAKMPLHEELPTSATNPYGRTKLMIEQILADVAASDPSWSMTALRYFNPVGAHESGLIGEDPQGVPNNLMPYIAQVAVGRLPRLRVFGDDYPTPDGTGVRDYIHVVDLADGHLAALRYAHGRPGMHVFNLGTGRGNSVLEMLAAFGRACGRELPYEVVPRRPGDVAACWADPTRAEQTLGWRAARTLEQMCADTWRWQSMNPGGYAD